MGGQYIDPMPDAASTPRTAPPAGAASRLAALWRRWPTRALCRGWSGQRLCEACVSRFAAPALRCAGCAIRLGADVPLCGACVREPPPFAAAIAAVDYVPPWDRLVAGFKFHDRIDLATAFADRMDAAWRAARRPAPQWLLPVPLASSRLRERGYNQSWELARRLAARWHCRADARVLLRIRDTSHQLALPPGRRAANVRGAFLIEPRRVAELAGRHLTLVDDVMTTGATAAEIARELLRAGAASVDVWMLARTPAPGE